MVHPNITAKTFFMCFGIFQIPPLPDNILNVVKRGPAINISLVIVLCLKFPTCFFHVCSWLESIRSGKHPREEF